MKWVLVALLILLPSVSGLQATDAENLIANGHYLEEGERAAVFKALPQFNGVPEYWLVSVYDNDVLRTILPVSDADSTLLEKGSLRTNLLNAQLLIQRLSVIKNSTAWLISISTANKIAELSTALENEQYDLDIVSKSITSASVASDVVSLKAKILTLSSDLRAISEEVKAINDLETRVFNVSISTSDAASLPDLYDSLYADLAAAASDASAYDSLVAQVKNRVANLEELDSTQKSQVIGLLSPLGPSQSLSGALSPYSDVAAENDQRVSVEAAGIPTKVAALEAEADARMGRAQSFGALYSDDASLQKFTTFTTLKAAADTILAEENKSRWKDKASVAKFQTAWEGAEKAYERKQYTTALDSAVTAKTLAKKIRDAGIDPVADPAQELSSTLVSGLVFVLAGVAIILVGKTAWKYMRPKQIE